MGKQRRMRSLLDEKGKPATPSYTKLKVYNAARRAHEALQIGKSAKDGIAKEIRYTDLMDARAKLRDIIRHIARADEIRNRAERAEVQYEALLLIPDIFISIRTLMDLKYLDDKRFDEATLKLEDTRRQLVGWYEYTLEEARKQEEGKALSDDDIDLLYDIPLPPGRRKQGRTAL